MSHPTQGQLVITPELAAELAPRILQGVEKREGGCWIRSIYKSSHGYTQIHRRVNGKQVTYYAHRVMYVFANGPIPDGLTIDHTCEARACCNPAHLRAVDHRSNVLRSSTNPYAINARKTHCVRGHEFVPHPRNPRWRHCPECNRIRQAEYAARKRSERGAA